MSFDKAKAMRNAERFLSQGKIRAAINEYKRVIEADPSDYSTLNMLGDLHVKSSEPDEAVICFTKVAEHYSSQGFSQKAIAIYNKISRLKPDSLEVSAKLAQLYQMKGSMAEAREHYTTVAEQYSKNGKRAEALLIWKQIASIDPKDADIFLKIADACWQEEQKEEAANAYVEAGTRLTAKKQLESAVTAYSRALEIRPDDLLALKGFAQSQLSLGFADEAAKSLESSLARQPNSREIMYLLIDCYVDLNSLKKAEEILVKLVEQEPSNYPKLLDLVKGYLKNRDFESATRILTMASEHLLVAGRAVELEELVNQILSENGEYIDAIRLLVRVNTWQRDEAAIRSAFERLAESAKNNNMVEDERNALTQLVMIVPQNAYFAQRLQELNIQNGMSQGFYENPTPAPQAADVPTFESYSALGDQETSIFDGPEPAEEIEYSAEAIGFEIVDAGSVISESAETKSEFSYSFDRPEVSENIEPAESFSDHLESVSIDENTDFNEVEPTVLADLTDTKESAETETNTFEHFASEKVDDSTSVFAGEESEPETMSTQSSTAEVAETQETDEEWAWLSEFERHKLNGEVEGVEFYIEQGFYEIADKTLSDLERSFGRQPELKKLRALLSASQATQGNDDVLGDALPAQPEFYTEPESIELKSEVSDELHVKETEVPPEAAVEEEFTNEVITEVTEENVAESETVDAEESIDEADSVELNEDVTGEVSDDSLEAVSEEFHTEPEALENELQTESVETEVETAQVQTDENAVEYSFDDDKSINEISPEEEYSAAEIEENAVAELEETTEPEVSENEPKEEAEESAESLADELVEASAEADEEVRNVEQEAIADTELIEETHELQVEHKEAENTQEIVAEAEDSINFETVSDDELDSVFNTGETADATEDVFELHYQTGVAYKEMGLIDDSIREFQDAVKAVSNEDGTKRYFLCSTLLAHSFMEKGMPGIAVMWYKRCFGAKDLTEDEINGLNYELANAYEKSGDKANAMKCFEEIYAFDVDYRDVGERLQNLLAS